MAHLRKRHLSQLIASKLLPFSPLVGILGHRQIGKTTVMEALSKNYFTLDDEQTFLAIKKNPKHFLNNTPSFPTGIDEVQQLPKLFPALKEYVRVHKRPGQFLLSGSVRFTSRKAIRESLTGRIVTVELLPLLISELQSRPLPHFFRKAILRTSFENWNEEKSPPKILKQNLKDFEKYLSTGGLPGACFIREPSLRTQRIDDQLQTILTRDLQQLVETRLAQPEIRALVESLATAQGEPIEIETLKQQTQISTPTLKKLVSALESLFLFRTLRVEGDRKGTVLYWEDIAESNFLSQNKVPLRTQLEQFCNIHLRSEWMYQVGSNATFFQFRTRGGSRIPLAVKTPEGVLGILPIDTEEPSRAETAWCQSFLRFYSQSKVIILGPKLKWEVLEPRILACSIGHSV